MLKIELNKKTREAIGEIASAIVPVLAVFCVLTLLITGFYYISGAENRLLETKEYNDMKLALEKDPGNDILKNEIRALDIKLRAGFKTRQNIMNSGKYIFILFLALFIASLRLSKEKAEVKARSRVNYFSKGPAALSHRALSVALVAGIAGLFLIVLFLISVFSSDRLSEYFNENSALDRKIFEENYVKNWHQFRGPAGMNVVSDGLPYPVKWSFKAGENILWKTPLSAGAKGNSSPIIWGDKIFITAAQSKKESRILCFEEKTGKLLWNLKADVARAFENESNGAGFSEDSLAASTPVTDGKFVYAAFANGDLVCADFSGKQVWGKSLGNLVSMYGFSSSPVLWKNYLILQLDQGFTPEDGLSCMVAFEKNSGSIGWKIKRQMINSWSSPVIVNTGARYELITAGNPFVISYNPDDGTELWRADGLSGDVAPSPVFSGKMIYAANTTAYLLAIKAGGNGDITKTHVAWKGEEGLPAVACPVAGNGLVVLAESGTITCYDGLNGKVLWANFPGGDFWSSPVLVNGNVYIITKSGKVIILQMSGTFKEISKFETNEEVSASPAFVNGKIYIRTKEALYCIGSKEGL